MPSPKVLELLVGSEDEEHEESAEKKKGQFGFKVIYRDGEGTGKDR
jgi:hypothetical protein